MPPELPPHTRLDRAVGCAAAAHVKLCASYVASADSTSNVPSLPGVVLVCAGT